MPDGTEIYGIEADVWATMGWQAKFEVMRDTLDEMTERLASAEAERDSLRQELDGVLDSIGPFEDDTERAQAAGGEG